jgi:putative Ca2+/H+ antiporter (TMEM165/GDT1 family)
MDAFVVSAIVVGLAEIGDKTQLLSLILAARFRRPLPIVFGILLATLANHAAASAAGMVFAQLLTGGAMRWALGISFLGVAVWALFPDKYEGRDASSRRYGAFLSTLAAFFLAEIGDKTQIATVGLGARFDAILPVMLGSTLGMMAANVPVVLLGGRLAARLPVKAIRLAATGAFAILGIVTLLRLEP